MNDRQKNILRIMYVTNNGKGIQTNALLKILKENNADGANDKTLSKDLRNLVEDNKLLKIPLGEKSSHGILYVPLIKTSIILYLQNLQENFLKILKHSLKTVNKSNHEEMLEMFIQMLVTRYGEILHIILLEKDGTIIYQIANNMFTVQLIEIKKIIDQKLTKSNIKNISKRYNDKSFYVDQNQFLNIIKKFKITFPDELWNQYTMILADMGKINRDILKNKALDTVTEEKIENIIFTENKNYVNNVFKKLHNDFKNKNPKKSIIHKFDENILFFRAFNKTKYKMKKHEPIPTELQTILDKNDKQNMKEYVLTLSKEQHQVVKNLISHYSKRKQELIKEYSILNMPSHVNIIHP